MDFSNFKTPDWLMVGGGLGFLIFGTFVDWAALGGFTGANAFDFFFRGTIPWILIVGTGVLAFLLAGGVIKAGTTPWPLIFLAATGVGTLLNLLLVIMGPEQDDFELDRAAGLWLSFLSAVVALVGAVLNFTSKGGDLKDLTNLDKLKSSFNQGPQPGRRGPSSFDPPPPPPPPPPSTPPPPPPPAP